MTPPASVERRAATPEKVLACLSLGYAVIVTGRLWSLIAPHQTMWPFPGAYFLEMLLLPGLVSILAIRSAVGRTRLAFAAAGATAAFCLLGAWSVGAFYLPLALLLAATAVIGRFQTREAFAVGAGWFVGGFVLQTAIVLGFARILTF